MPTITTGWARYLRQTLTNGFKVKRLVGGCLTTLSNLRVVGASGASPNKLDLPFFVDNSCITRVGIASRRGRCSCGTSHCCRLRRGGWSSTRRVLCARRSCGCHMLKLTSVTVPALACLVVAASNRTRGSRVTGGMLLTPFLSFRMQKTTRDGLALFTL